MYQNYDSSIQYPASQLIKTAILKDRLYVPSQHVTASMLEAYEHMLEVGKDPLTEEPVMQKYSFYEYINMGDHGYYAFSRGNLRKIKEVFAGFNFVDQRQVEPMRNRLLMKFPEGMNYRSYQYPAIETFNSSDSGLIKAPPRSGKTLMMTSTICLDGQKTLVLAHQTDLLVQLYDTIEKFTNVSEIRTKDNPVVGFPTCLEDFYKMDVCLCTKQTFDHMNNKDLGRIVQKLFGSVLVDEAHWLPGPMYSHFVNRFDAKYRRGVTATPARKDGLQFCLFEIIGPIVYEVKRSEVGFVPMEVLGIKTFIKPAAKAKKYADIITDLCNNDSRNRFISAWMDKDVKDGKTIFAVTDRKDHTTSFANYLRDLGISAHAFNGKFTQKATRKGILDNVRNGKTSVLVAMRQMATGLDIPRADTFYNLTPSSNAVANGEDEGEGGYEQQCTRILTPFEGKSVAIVRDFLDDFGPGWAAWTTRKKTYNKLEAKIRVAADGEIGKSHMMAPVQFDYGNQGFDTF